MTRLVYVLAGLSILLASITVPALAVDPVECEKDYVVQEGDRLQKIAEAYYGDKAYYDEIVEATNAQAATDDTYHSIENPSYIRANWQLCLPPVQGLSVGSTGSEVSAAPAGLEPEALMNMTYQNQFGPDGTVTLQDGEYEVEAAPGSASKIQVELTEYIAYGELNGQPAAAVILWSSGGGTGVFFDVHVVMLQDGQPVDVATAPIEDRAEINSIQIEDGKIIVDTVGHGPDDPMCCPTQQQIRTYELVDGNLEQTNLEVTGTVVEESAVVGTGLTGVIWLWTNFKGLDTEDDVTVIYPPGYRLELKDDGTFTVQADCNVGSGGYKVEGDSLTLEAGPMTMAFCGETSQDQEFLRLLDTVDSYHREDGKLTLTTPDGTMNFRRLYAATGLAKTAEPVVFEQAAMMEVTITEAAVDAGQVGGLVKEITQLPADFEANYTPAEVDPSSTYALDITVTDPSGTVLYASPEPVSVLTQGNPTYHVDVTLEAK